MDDGKGRTGLRRLIPRTWKGRTFATVLGLVAVVAVLPHPDNEGETASVTTDVASVGATTPERAHTEPVRTPVPVVARTPSTKKPPKPVKKPAKKPVKKPAPAATTVTYENCSAVRAAGKAPLRRGQPGYAARLDRDGDGVACESSGSSGRSSSTAAPARIVGVSGGGGAATVSYANCAAARAAGAAPVHRGDPGYAPHLDRDGDGIGCE